LKVQTVLLIALAGAVVASPITYTLSTSGGGTIGSTAFSDNNITFTQVSDTSMVGNCFTVDTCPAASTTNTITIQGIGTYTITDSTQFYDNPGLNGIGFIDNVSTLLIENDPAFTTYNMVTNLGPIFDVVGTHSATNVNTSGGLLSFTGNSLDATFQAVTSSSSAPEPGSLGLMVMGAFALVASRKHRS
jgi:hypothetical protein